jgi:integrase/recombinase XerD
MAKTKPYWPHVTGPLAQYADEMRAELVELGYTPLSAASKLRLVAHLSRWLTSQDLDASSLSEQVVKAYFVERRAAGYTNDVSAGALKPLLGYLRRVGVAPLVLPKCPVTASEQLLARYKIYLALERGLLASTAELNARLLSPFLDEYLVTPGGELETKRLTAGDVASFVIEQSGCRPGSVKRIVSALRSFLGYLYLEGMIDRALAASVPSPAGWALTGIPKALSDDEVAALLASCDTERAAGRRDLAILTVLARLGLRAGEVATLGLDDIDWRRGEMVVRGKGKRIDRLPLPADVGERITDYLRDGRPATVSCRSVFMTALAPHRPLSPCGVTTVVAAAARRAGLGTIHAHRLRHTAATAMLRAGGSLREIGDVLRHRRALTTAVYAKLDVEALRGLARRWPEAAA